MVYTSQKTTSCKNANVSCTFTEDPFVADSKVKSATPYLFIIGTNLSLLFQLNRHMLNTHCHFPDPDDPYKLTEDTKERGLVVCRGTAVVLICPMDGCEAIANPFIQQDT